METYGSEGADHVDIGLNLILTRHNQIVDPRDSPLLKAVRLCPAEARTELGVAVVDVLEYLKHDEWEMALLLLEELGDAHPQLPEFWGLLDRRPLD